MKQKKDFDGFKLVTTLMFIIGIAGIGIFLLSLFLPKFLRKADDTPLNVREAVPRNNQQRDNMPTPYGSNNFSQNDLIRTAEIDTVLSWLESLDNEKLPNIEKSMSDEKPMDNENLTSGFDDEPENTSSEPGLTPEQQKEVDSIRHRLYDGTDEYQGLVEILMTDVPWTPEVGERRDRARHRLYELDDELPRLLSQYYFITRDMDGLEQFLPLFEGLMEIELLSPIEEGEVLRMEITPPAF